MVIMQCNACPVFFVGNIGITVAVTSDELVSVYALFNVSSKTNRYPPLNCKLN